jgi:uncharacterized membrane protein YedE/YeeE
MVPGMYVLTNTALGVSTGYGSLLFCALANTNLKWLRTTFKERWSWRVFFLGGMALGGFVSARLEGRPLVSPQMGALTANVPAATAALILFTGGLLLGLGARIAGGCTSGHSIHGIANLHLGSIVATAAFFVAGIIATRVLVLPLLRGWGL